MLFGRDVVLPVDNLLWPRRKYIGEDNHKLILQKQHQIFTRAKGRMRRAQKRKNARVNKRRKEVRLEVGDPVFYKVHQREGKLDRRREPYYRIIDQTGRVTLMIWDQMSGVKREHANDLK